MVDCLITENKMVYSGVEYTIGETLIDKTNSKKTMKYKRAFVEFEHLGRNMTIAILGDDELINIGLSIHNPEDKYDKQMGRRIAEGRAWNKPIINVFDLSEPFCYDYGILKSIGFHMKSRIIRNLTFDEVNKCWNYDNI